MGHGQQRSPDLSRTQFWRQWIRTPEAQALRPPHDIMFLDRYPDNFGKIRDAFNVAYFTYQMLDA